MTYLINPFAGSIGRGRWWLAQLVIFAMAIGGLFLTVLLFSDPAAPVSSRTDAERFALNAIILSAIYMNFSTSLNRLRHTGRSGLWYLSFLLPVVGTGLMLYFCGLAAGRGGGAGAAPAPRANPADAVADAHPSRPVAAQRVATPHRRAAFGRR